jgi:hypothetical protein
MLVVLVPQSAILEAAVLLLVPEALNEGGEVQVARLLLAVGAHALLVIPENRGCCKSRIWGRVATLPEHLLEGFCLFRVNEPVVLVLLHANLAHVLVVLLVAYAEHRALRLRFIACHAMTSLNRLNASLALVIIRLVLHQVGQGWARILEAETVSGANPSDAGCCTGERAQQAHACRCPQGCNSRLRLLACFRPIHNRNPLR